MSARVVRGLAPSGKPHPTAKWSLLMALLVVVWLGVPKFAAAGSPFVQPPTGPGYAYDNGTYYFTGTYSFPVYMNCSGSQYTYDYLNSLNGTHEFDFYGAPDGSLLVEIDGGGQLVEQSCGNPNNGTPTLVASYSVAIGSPPTPSPTPSATPSPTPTPAPPPHITGGGSSSHTGSSSTGSSTTTTSSGVQTGAVTAPPPVTQTTTQPAQSSPVISTQPSPVQHPVPKPVQPKVSQIPSWLVSVSLELLLLVLLILLYLESEEARSFVKHQLSRANYQLEPYWFKVKTTVKRLLKIYGRELLKRRGLSEHHHSGKVMAHHHTSYASLAFLLIVATFFVTSQTVATLADATASSTLSLTVLGPPPSSPAVINIPTPGAHFNSPTQTVLGTCPGDVFVEIWRNGVFAGSSICDSNDLFSVLITLVPGPNDLVARVVDALGQYGPDSNHVPVIYDQPKPSPSPSPSPTPSPTPSPSKSPSPTTQPSGGSTTTTPTPPAVSPVIVTSAKHFYQGFSPDQSVGWQVNVSGGVPTYEVTWEWGDATKDTDFLGGPGPITMTHQYQKAGDYNVIIRAIDKAGSEGVLQVVVVVNGAAISNALNSDTPGNLVLIWPLLIMAALTVLSFWLGEKHEWAILKPRAPARILHSSS